jgi:fatty-acyl-CoA synthase
MSPAVENRRAAMARRHPIWVEMTLDAYFDRAAADFAARPLVLTDDVSLSYAQAADQSRRIAAGLAAIGIAAGDRVGIVMANLPMVVPLLLAIWRAGAVAVPMNTLSRAEELEYAIREAECAVLVIMERFGSRTYVADLDARAPGWRDGPSTAFPALRHVLVCDDPCRTPPHGSRPPPPVRTTPPSSCSPPAPPVRPKA